MATEKVIIDFNDPLLREGIIYTQFVKQVNDLMLSLINANIDVPVALRGTQAQVDSFFDALRRERRYMNSYVKHGLNDPKTLNYRHRLDGAVGRFEKETGLKWPFKN